MAVDIKSEFLKKDIEFYIDMLIKNEAWISHHLLKRTDLKITLEKLEKELKDHLINIKEYEIKEYMRSKNEF